MLGLSANTDGSQELSTGNYDDLLPFLPRRVPYDLGSR